MKTVRPSLAAAALLSLTFCSALLAADDIKVSEAYARAVPPGSPNSAAFMQIHNADANDHALVSASSPAAKVVELHTHIHEDGMMKMRKIDSIDLPAGKATHLKPGGLHVMLIDLIKDLNDGDQLQLTLEFDNGSQQQLNLPVKSIHMEMKHPSGHMMKH
jgi:copper(I)-binding protein